MLTYRHTTLEDLPKIDEWVAADPSHVGVMTGTDFILLPNEETGEVPKGTQCIEVLDDKGTVFYLRFRNALIVETQFPPAAPSGTSAPLRQHVRVSKALKEAFAYFVVASKHLGYHAMLFDSVSELLIAFFEGLGFKKLKNYFKADL